jgi:hypothetical protein
MSAADGTSLALAAMLNEAIKTGTTKGDRAMNNRRILVLSPALITALLLAGIAGPQPSLAQTQPVKRVVRCVAEYPSGHTTQVMQCKASGFGSFTLTPSGQYFSITDVLVTPYSSASTTVTGIQLQKTLPTSLWDLYYIRHTGGSTHSESYRTPPLVLSPGTQLTLTTWSDTNSAGQIVVTGQLTSDPDGGAH